MKCPRCSFDNKHDGIFCTDCGNSFIDIKFPEVCYSIRGISNLAIEVNNFIPLSQKIEFEKLVIGGKEFSVNQILGTKSTYNFSVESSLNKVEYPEIDFKFKHNVSTFHLSFTKKIKFSPLPKLEIIGIKSEPLLLSPNTNYTKSIEIELKNNSIIKIDKILLLEISDSPDLMSGNPTNVRAKIELPIIENHVELSAETPRQTITVNFSSFKNHPNSGNHKYKIMVHNIYGSNNEINEDIISPEFEIDFRELVPLTIGIFHATDKGFAYVCDNKLVKNGLEPGKVVISAESIDEKDLIDVGNWRERIGNDISVSDRFSQFYNSKIKLNIPKGIKRRRRFTLLKNYEKERENEYDIKNNYCSIKIIPVENYEGSFGSQLTDFIKYRAVNINESSTEFVALNEELVLPDLRDFNYFEVEFYIPFSYKGRKEILLDFIIVRKNEFGDEIDQLKYNLILNPYLPQVLPGNVFIAFDLGTSNTCLVGPFIDRHGEIEPEIPVCYPLNYYHEISDQIKTFPSLIAYEFGEDGSVKRFYIHDGLKPRKEKSVFENFKIKIPDEINGDPSLIQKPVKYLQQAVDFISCTIENLQIYFEDRGCVYSLFNSIKLTSPSGFVPEVREIIARKITEKLKELFGRENSIQIIVDNNLDESEAVLIYALENNLIPISNEENEIYLFIIYDFGGGTTDTAALLISNYSRALLYTGGSRRVGGTTIDKWICNRLKYEPSSTETYRFFNVELEESKVKPEVESLFEDAQKSFEISKIKHYFHVKKEIDQGFNPKISFNINDIFKNNGDNDNNDDLQSQIDSVVNYIKEEDEKENPWNDNKIIFSHLLLPFYESFYEKSKKIVRDTIASAIKKIKRNKLIKDGKKVNLVLLTAGNASRIAFFENLMSYASNLLKQEYQYIIKDIQIRAISEAKESVAIGAYLTQTIGFGIEKMNNPPFTYYIPQVSLFQMNHKKGGDEQGIIIFREGEKRENSEFPEILVRKFKADELEIRPSQTHITISKKVGIDMSLSEKQNIPILGNISGKYIAFILNTTNKIEVYRFDDVSQLFEDQNFKKFLGSCKNIENKIKEMLK